MAKKTVLFSAEGRICSRWLGPGRADRQRQVAPYRVKVSRGSRASGWKLQHRSSLEGRWDEAQVPTGGLEGYQTPMSWTKVFTDGIDCSEKPDPHSKSPLGFSRQ